MLAIRTQIMEHFIDLFQSQIPGAPCISLIAKRAVQVAPVCQLKVENGRIFYATVTNFLITSYIVEMPVFFSERPVNIECFRPVAGIFYSVQQFNIQ